MSELQTMSIRKFEVTTNIIKSAYKFGLDMNNTWNDAKSY